MYRATRPWSAVMLLLLPCGDLYQLVYVRLSGCACVLRGHIGCFVVEAHLEPMINTSLRLKNQVRVSLTSPSLKWPSPIPRTETEKRRHACGFVVITESAETSSGTRRNPEQDKNFYPASSTIDNKGK
ncbi:hypothetical protein BDV11DRAFT_177978 [Aspergillus similis]